MPLSYLLGLEVNLSDDLLFGLKMGDVFVYFEYFQRQKKKQEHCGILKINPFCFNGIVHPKM